MPDQFKPTAVPVNPQLCPSWPYDKPVPADHTVIPVVDGLEIVATPAATADDLADMRELAAKIQARRAQAVRS